MMYDRTDVESAKEAYRRRHNLIQCPECKEHKIMILEHYGTRSREKAMIVRKSFKCQSCGYKWRD